MTTPRIEYLTVDVSQSSLKLVFVDDCFFAPEGWPFATNELEKPAIRDTHLEWLRNPDARTELANRKLLRYQRTILEALLGLRDGCKERDVAFGVANFEYLEEIEVTGPESKDTLFLVDVQYANPAILQSALYGFWIVRKWYAKHKHAIRFCTRMPGVVNHSEEYDGTEFSGAETLGVPTEHMLGPDVPSRILEWVDSFLFHEDPYIADALCFYCQPWENPDLFPMSGSRVKGWDHDRLEKDTDLQTQSLGKWLGVESNVVADNFAKCLLAKNAIHPEGKPDRWNSRDGYREGRPIDGHLLKSLFEKFGMKLQLDLKESYYLPCQPAMHFLIALRSLTRVPAVNEEGLQLTKHSGKSGCVYILHIPLREESNSDRSGFHLSESLCGVAPTAVKIDDPKIGHTLTNHLVWWIHCKTKLTKMAGSREHLRQFEAGCVSPVVTLEFHNNAVNAIWTGRK